MSQSPFTRIASIPIDFSPDKRTLFQIPGKQGETFRFVDIAAFLDRKSLDVYSITDLHEIKDTEHTYACVSYPWRGLEFLPKGEDELLNTNALIDIFGLKAYAAISVRMLQIACIAAQRLGCRYLWMDKLCVRQDEPKDDTPDQGFQVKNMFNVYSFCTVCLVFAGGMLRLPKIDENTTWIDRAWTLQEALAPKDVRVLFKWSLGPKRLRPVALTGEENAKPVPIEELEKGIGMAELKPFLECSTTVGNAILPADENEPAKEPEHYLDDVVLVQFLHSKEGQFFGPMRLLSAMSRQDSEGRLNAIWRCLIIRQSKFKEDLVFSSMGIMGVNVMRDGINRKSDFNDIEVMDLVIRLVKELIKKGYRAEWLGIAPSCGPCVGYSSLPNMPLQRSVGHGYEKRGDEIWPIDEADQDNWWWLRESPQCIVHENADVSFTSKAVSLELAKEQDLPGDHEEQKYHPDRLVNQVPKKAWTIRKDLSDSKLYAVYVGTKEWYESDLFGNMRESEDRDVSLLMILELIEPGRFRNTGYVYGDENLTKDWPEISFRIGG